MHSISVTWHACTKLGGKYKAKQASRLKKHRAAVHDIDVLWWFCDYEGCEYKAKSNRQITVHKTDKHTSKWELSAHRLLAVALQSTTSNHHDTQYSVTQPSTLHPTSATNNSQAALRTNSCVIIRSFRSTCVSVKHEDVRTLVRTKGKLVLVRRM